MTLVVDDLPARSTYTGQVNSAGVCEIPVRVQGLVAWQVEQVTIDMPTAPVGAVASLLVNDDLVTPMIAAGDAAGGDPPLPLHPGDTLLVRWTGATAGDRAKVLIIYRRAAYSR